MRGILFSFALHTLVLLAAALGLPWLAKPPANASRNIEVDIVRLSDITQVSKGGKPKPETERKPDAERETTRKPVARDRRAEKPPVEPEPVKPKPPAPPKKVAEPKPPKKTAVAKPKATPPAPPRPAKRAEPAPKPKTAAPRRVEIDPRALQRQTEKPKKPAPAKKPEPVAPKPVAKPENKPKKPVETAAKPKMKPEPKPPKPAKETAPKIERQVAALPRPRPPAKPRPEKSAKPPRKTAKKKPAKKDALDSVFKTVGRLKESEQSDRERTASRTQAGQKTAASSLPMTLSEIEAVRRQIRACWNFPAGAQGAGSLRVLVKIWLNRDGSLRGEPQVLDKVRFGNDPRFRVAAEAGLRAINNPRCSPLRLPPEKFDRWKEMTIDFDPSKLSSG